MFHPPHQPPERYDRRSVNIILTETIFFEYRSAAGARSRPQESAVRTFRRAVVELSPLPFRLRKRIVSTCPGNQKTAKYTEPCGVYGYFGFRSLFLTAGSYWHWFCLCSIYRVSVRRAVRLLQHSTQKPGRVSSSLQYERLTRSW